MQGDTGTALVYSSFFLVFLREGLSINFFLFTLFFVCIFVLGLLLDTNILYVIVTVLFLVLLGLSIKNIQRIMNATIFFILTLVIINGQDFVMTNLLSIPLFLLYYFISQ